MSSMLKEFFIHALKEDTSGAAPTFKGTPAVKTDPAAAAGAGITPNPAAGETAAVVTREGPEALTFFKNQVPGIITMFGDSGIDPSGLEAVAAALDGVAYNHYMSTPNPLAYKTHLQTTAGGWAESIAEILNNLKEGATKNKA